MLTHTERRLQARAILGGTQCLSPASVFDPLSARVAEMVGYQLGLLSGSVASGTTLAAAVAALHEVYTHLYHGGDPAGLKAQVATGETMDRLTRGEEHRQWQRLFLG